MQTKVIISSGLACFLISVGTNEFLKQHPAIVNPLAPGTRFLCIIKNTTEHTRVHKLSFKNLHVLRSFRIFQFERKTSIEIKIEYFNKEIVGEIFRY